MTRNFPDLLEHTLSELVFPPLTVACRPSRTASAIFTADAGWRFLLDDDNLSLRTHLNSMADLARYFCSMDDTLAGTLDRTW